MAQLEVLPLPRELPASKTQRQARIKSHTPLALPFWDDFSSQAPGYADTALWVDSHSVNISDGAGINVPSINVAVFNGLDSLGSPYSANDPTLTGFTDKLESGKILLGQVPANQKDSVYLSFFYQWSGNGEPPDATDYLQVEFRDSSDVWVKMLTIYGNEIEDNSVFNAALIKVETPKFLHDDFQFRIRSYGRLSGPFDTWLVDYIYLDDRRAGIDTSFPDRAIASTMSPLYGKYFAMPYKHFLADKKLDTVRFDVYNLRGPNAIPASVNYSAFATLTDYTGENPPAVTNITLGDPIDIKDDGSGALLPLERAQAMLSLLPDVNNSSQFDPSADSVDVRITLRVNSGDKKDTTRFHYLPLDFTLNDTITTSYPLRQYYAYDDGRADYTVRLTNPGNRLAYRFVMPIDTATLYGFYIYFPYAGGPSSEQLDFYIYPDVDGKPGSPVSSVLSRTITKNGSNQFMKVPIEALFLTDSIFYIGYKQPVSDNIRLGLDKNNDTGENIFVFANNAWTQSTDVHGSLMIRPFFGKGNGVITALPENESHVMLHPNPNKGEFVIPGEVTQLTIFDITGKTISWHMDESNGDKEITLDYPSSGVYFVRWTNQRGTYTRKIFVGK